MEDVLKLAEDFPTLYTKDVRPLTNLSQFAHDFLGIRMVSPASWKIPWSQVYRGLSGLFPF